jgi:putative Mg2+ transporter-C (MgtC) family protein
MPDVESIIATSQLGYQVIAARLAIALVLGGILGFDREVRNRPAGIRTHMLVAMASALFTIVALEIVSVVGPKDDVSSDPVRVIEAVTAGVAFLAAGTIIRAGGRVEGVTTGAGLWLAGAVGLACGLGLWAVAAIAVAFGVFVLVAIGLVTRALGSGRKAHDPSHDSGRNPAGEGSGGSGD